MNWRRVDRIGANVVLAVLGVAAVFAAVFSVVALAEVLPAVFAGERMSSQAALNALVGLIYLLFIGYQFILATRPRKRGLRGGGQRDL